MEVDRVVLIGVAERCVGFDLAKLARLDLRYPPGPQHASGKCPE